MSKELEISVRKRSAMKAKLTNFANFINILLSCESISSLQRIELEGRLSKFDAIYDEFDTLQMQIEVLMDKPDEAYVERAEFEGRFHLLAAQARSLLAASDTGEVGSATGSMCKQSGESQRSFVRLPKISLPTFDGGYQYWLEFRDTYISLIHNSSCIDDISKFHYLRASLNGDALELIKNIHFKSEHYHMAWSLLCDRYNNNRLLVNNHVQALFNVEKISKEACSSLRHLVDVINKNIRALKTLNEPTEYWDTLVVYMMSVKLDSITSRDWEEHRNTIEKSPTLAQFCLFISKKADLLETLEHNKQCSSIVESKPKSFVATTDQGANQNHTQVEKIPIKCPLCEKHHLLYTCEDFRKLSVDSRLSKAKELKVCMNCLRFGHLTKQCRLSRCKYCSDKHNVLLHVDKPKNVNLQDPFPSFNTVTLPTDVAVGASLPTCSPENVVLSNDISLHHTTASSVLLSTALVKVVDNFGNKVDARILLDNGSTANFITQKLADKLKLSRRSTSSIVTGINTQISTTTQSCKLVIESRYGNYKTSIDCFVLPVITKALPSVFIDIDKIPLPSNVQLADPSFYSPSVVDILVGAELFWSCLGPTFINLGKNQPTLRDTKFGWIVSGSVPVSYKKSTPQSHFCNFSLVRLNNTLSKFWELESVSAKYSLTREERACENSFKSDTVRDQTGRFVVTMPLKKDPSVLGESFYMAKRRFLSLERRFQRDPVFKERYVTFMQEYERLGHMTENDTLGRPHSGDIVEYFVPHHGVIKESSATTKLRAVFDASAATTSGSSLNDIQMVGPTVQDDLFTILVRFRQHKFVITADVEKMYRAILLTPAQRPLQQIIFRADSTLPLKTYKLNTLTYGTASAPYLATRCLVSLASAVSNKRVKESIEHDFYVDDYLGGGESISEVLDIAREVVAVLASAHFYLRKWQSNSTEILSQMKGSVSNSSCLNFADNENVASKTLGLHWLCESDYLVFSINVDCSTEQVTKRHILSVISQIFDPLGLVGPCIVEAKIIMQRLWMLKCGWDESIPNEIQGLWNSFVSTLPCLNLLKIPRWVTCENLLSCELHTFTDASERAYGACVYLRSTSRDGLVTVKLLVSKNRVGPVKPCTIPKLELCAAVLGTRLCTSVLKSLTVPINTCHFWCDSTIVLGWLSITPTSLKTFVRNRVNEIQECTAGHKWSYVPSKDNPADLVSRGLKAEFIKENSLWWNGPEFLSKDEFYWPKCPNENMKQDLPEIISSHFIHNSLSLTQNSITSHNQSFIQSLFTKFSEFNKLQRLFAYWMRYIHNLKYKHNKIVGSISAQELNNSLNFILRHAQMVMFPKEYSLLKSDKPLPSKNRLLSLSPFIDSEGLIRVGGRLDNSPYDYNVKHPILLCTKHHITKILFSYYHLNLLHAGPQLLLATIRQKYWPLGGRNLAKVTVKQCIKCFRLKCQNVQPIMGQLPSSRTLLQYPFFNCSVDYAGPVLIANRQGRGCKLIKSYLCIFVCLAVKAVHIELVTDLTKEGYMAALNRFVARRGKPKSIMSDNGTNFVGACNELGRFLQTAEIDFDVRQQGIEFSFVPPFTPHFNGITESAVKSTKHHLRRLMGLTHFTYEQMSTCLTQIEAILNSRPLTPLSSDPLDFTVLTPSHFLIGRPLTSIPHPQVSDVAYGRLERYQQMEHIRQHFWNRFHLEYVSLLQTKTKWTASTGRLTEGTLVLIKERGQPPLVWPLGRVIDTVPGRDGEVRVVKLKTSRGTVLRAFNNVCPLPIN